MLCVKIVLFLTVVRYCDGKNAKAKYKKVKELYDTTLETHSKYIEPPSLDSVDMKITLDALLGLEEVEEKLDTLMTLKMDWIDETVAWSFSKYKVVYLSFDDTVVWKPVMEIGNPHGSKEAPFRDASKKMVYYGMDGSASWWTTTRLATQCDIDTTYFPFDKQTCFVRLKFPINGYEINLIDPDRHLKVNETSNWKITKYQIWMEITYGTTELVFKYHFERKPLGAFINLILPVFILACLTPMVFLLQKDGGDRIGLSLTTLLAISVYMTLVADALPKTSDPIPIITIVMFIWYTSNMCIVILVLLNARMYRLSDRKKVPTYVQRFVIFTRRCFCQEPVSPADHLQATSVNTMPVDTKDADRNSLILQNLDILVSEEQNGKPDSENVSAVENHHGDIDTNIKWRHVSSALDKWFIIVIYLLKLIFAIVIGCVLKAGSKDDDNYPDDMFVLEWVYNSTTVM